VLSAIRLRRWAASRACATYEYRLLLYSVCWQADPEVEILTDFPDQLFASACTQQAMRKSLGDPSVKTGSLSRRESNLLVAHDYANMLIPALDTLAPQLAGGCVAVLRNGRLPVRKLPSSA
jgi:hypothetical protein